MNKQISFSISYSESDYCYSCEHVFASSEKKFKGNLHVFRTTNKKGSIHENIRVECVCRNCHMVDAAHLEAKDESRRVTEICIGLEDSQMGYTYGTRCPCGNATHHLKDWCLLCESEKRLMKRVDAETKLFRRMLSELNKQVKETTKQNTELNLL